MLINVLLFAALTGLALAGGVVTERFARQEKKRYRELENLLLERRKMVLSSRRPEPQVALTHYRKAG